MMERQISAVEFLEKKQEYVHRAFVSALAGFSLCELFGAWTIIRVKWLMGDPTFLHVTFSLVLVIVIPFACFFGIVKIAEKARDNFVKNHSEMRDLDDWQNDIGPAETYPITDAEKIAFVPRALSFITQYAQLVNMTMYVRDLGKSALGACTKPSERQYVTKILEYLNEQVDVHVQAYNRRFRLLTERRKVLCGPEFDSAKDFREKLIKATPAT